MSIPELIRFFSMITPGGVGIWTIVMMVSAFLIREWRETRKMSAEDRLARREGYAAQVKNLQDENRALYADLHTVREEHDKYRKICQVENDQLRGMLIALQDELAAYKRRIDTLSLTVAAKLETARGGVL